MPFSWVSIDSERTPDTSNRRLGAIITISQFVQTQISRSRVMEAVGRCSAKITVLLLLLLLEKRPRRKRRSEERSSFVIFLPSTNSIKSTFSINHSLWVIYEWVVTNANSSPISKKKRISSKSKTTTHVSLSYSTSSSFILSFYSNPTPAIVLFFCC